MAVGMVAIRTATSPIIRCNKIIQAVRVSARAVPINGGHALLCRSYASSCAETTWNDEMIQRSVVPTMHYQKSLPRLPVPKLEDTLTAYLKNVSPLLSPEEFNTTKKIVQDFKTGEGPVLQKILESENNANPHTSYISKLWFDVYLASRTPLPINYNPFIAFRPDPIEEKNTQVNRATNLAYSAARFMKALDEHKLEPDVYHLKPKISDTDWFKKMVRWVPQSLSWYASYLVKAFPLDMSQYKRLFASTRIPAIGKDELRSFKNSRHIMVIHRGNFYPVDILQISLKPRKISDIHADIRAVLSDKTPTAEFDLCLLTSDERDVWARARQELTADATNANMLEQIDSALFTLTLDESHLNSETELSYSFLHGEGKNRWWDKSLSMYVSANGRSALSFEHAWGDGVAVLRAFNELHKDAVRAPVPESDTVGNVKPLHFSLNDNTKKAVKVSEKRMKEAYEPMDIKFLLVGKWPEDEKAFASSNALHADISFGKKICKQHKMSPDGVVQMAFQLAYSRLTNGGTAATYESCSTAAFKHGRTETVRPASDESVVMCKAFASPTEPISSIRQKLDDAQRRHSRLVMKAAIGKGVDRHLLTLKTIAERSGGSAPALFNDISYSRNNHIILSTSTLASPALIMGGFGPVTRDGYGIGYMVDDDLCGFNITSYRKDLPQFLEALRTSIIDIKAVMNNEEFRTPKN